MSPTQRVRFVIRAVANVVVFTIVGFMVACALWAVIVVVFDPSQSVVRLLWGCVLVGTGLVAIAVCFVQFRGRRVVALPSIGIGIGIDLSDPTMRVRLRSGRPDDREQLAAISDASEASEMGSRADDVPQIQGKRFPGPEAKPVVAGVVVADSSTDAAVGLVILRSDEEGGSCCEFDWLLHPDPSGQGLVHEVFALASRLAAQLGFATLRLGTAKTDGAMQRAAEVGGACFVREGLHTFPNGEDILARWYEMPLQGPGMIASVHTDEGSS
jgi:RimJ/RimL family protein N-acetyltransferase